MNGFKILWEHNIIHWDLKLENILINEDIVKIGDFGMAKLGINMTITIIGTFLTMAPELLKTTDED